MGVLFSFCVCKWADWVANEESWAHALRVIRECLPITYPWLDESLKFVGL